MVEQWDLACYLWLQESLMWRWTFISACNIRENELTCLYACTCAWLRFPGQGAGFHSADTEVHACR